MRARFATIKIEVDGQDVTASVGEYLTTLKYSDSLRGESDSVEMVLSDSDHSLLKNFAPKRGSIAKITVVKNSWNSQQFAGNASPESLYLGAFELDEINYAFPPSKWTLKFNSVPHTTQIKRVEKYRAWENVKLSKIAGDIASGAGLELYFDVTEDPVIERAEQSEQSDIQFLSNLCRDKGYGVKVHNMKLIVFDEDKLERADAVTALTYGDGIIKSFSGKATLTGLFGDAVTSFTSNGLTDFLFGIFGDLEFLRGSFNAPSVDRNDPRTLKIFEKASSEAEGERLARARLRDANKNEFQIRLTLMGSFGYLSGNTLYLSGFGLYDGKYIIERADHELGDGYTTQVTLNKCLDY